MAHSCSNNCVSTVLLYYTGVTEIWLPVFIRYDNKGCGRSYLSQRDLEAHIAYRHKEKTSSTITTVSTGANIPRIPLPPFFAPPPSTRDISAIELPVSNSQKVQSLEVCYACIHGKAVVTTCTCNCIEKDWIAECTRYKQHRQQSTLTKGLLWDPDPGPSSPSRNYANPVHYLVSCPGRDPTAGLF